MDLYKLDTDFLRSDPIDQFTSLIWTERYSSAGDVTLVTEANRSSVALLPEGCFLGLEGSQEVMLIETQSIEDGMMTVTGNSLLAFLQNRTLRTSTEHALRNWNLDGWKPGELLSVIVQYMCIDGAFPTPLAEATHGVIPGLSLGPIDSSGDAVTVSIPFGPVYEALQTLAETYQRGMSLYLDSASIGGYSLKFKSYNGRDLTSDQTTYPVVRFSSAMDSLTDTKEIRSIAGYKNVCYAYAPSVRADLANPNTGFALAPGVTIGDLEGFNRRVMMIFVEDGIDNDVIEALDPTVAGNLVHEILSAKARDALANNNYTKIVDGEVVPQTEFQFGTNYNLGDIIELQGASEIVQKARVTEYIRSEDSTGERSYPTVSVID